MVARGAQASLVPNFRASLRGTAAGDGAFEEIGLPEAKSQTGLLVPDVLVAVPRAPKRFFR
jgi:hypothetical protein